MNKILKKIAWWCNVLLASVLVVIEMVSLLIGSLVVIVISPLLAFVNANNFKLEDQTSRSWWGQYKVALIEFCTDELPIVVYSRHF